MLTSQWLKYSRAIPAIGLPVSDEDMTTLLHKTETTKLMTQFSI